MNPTNSTGALAQLEKTQSTAQDPNAILASQRQALGVNNAQDTVTGLRGAIDNTTKLLSQVAPSVMGRTGNSLVTNAQATRQIQNEQAPLSTNLNQEGTDYNNATSDLNNLQSEATQAASGIYQGQQDKESYLQNVYNTLYQKEQDAKAQQTAAQAAKVQQQQFEESLSASKTAAASNPLNYLGSSSASTPSKVGTMGLKVANTPAAGFYFRDTNGNVINALQYSKANKANFKGVVQQMADKGDTGAAAYLKLGVPTSTKGYSPGSSQYNLIKDFIG